jgi:hypothetical protein
MNLINNKKNRVIDRLIRAIETLGDGVQEEGYSKFL